MNPDTFKEIASIFPCLGFQDEYPLEKEFDKFIAKKDPNDKDNAKKSEYDIAKKMALLFIEWYQPFKDE
jgi:hypothetical protein